MAERAGRVHGWVCCAASAPSPLLAVDGPAPLRAEASGTARGVCAVGQACYRARQRHVRGACRSGVGYRTGQVHQPVTREVTAGQVLEGACSKPQRALDNSPRCIDNGAKADKTVPLAQLGIAWDSLKASPGELQAQLALRTGSAGSGAAGSATGLEV